MGARSSPDPPSPQGCSATLHPSSTWSPPEQPCPSQPFPSPRLPPAATGDGSGSGYHTCRDSQSFLGFWSLRTLSSQLPQTKSTHFFIHTVIGNVLAGYPLPQSSHDSSGDRAGPEELMLGSQQQTCSWEMEDARLGTEFWRNTVYCWGGARWVRGVLTVTLE